MNTIDLTLTQTKRGTVSVELDADRLETLAASLGLFSDEFLETIRESEREYRAGRYKKVSSLAELVKDQRKRVRA
jgi:hypothetical protein